MTMTDKVNEEGSLVNMSHRYTVPVGAALTSDYRGYKCMLAIESGVVVAVDIATFDAEVDAIAVVVDPIENPATPGTVTTGDLITVISSAILAKANNGATPAVYTDLIV